MLMIVRTSPAKNSSDEQAVTLDGHDPVLLVEN
jgi:hypothetical protein